MLTIASEVFDAVIKGTSTTWYTAEQHDAGLGAADRYSIVVAPTAVGGTSPTLTVVAQESADDQRWADLATLISGVTPVSNTAITAAVSTQRLRFGRLKITMGGTNPTCRLSITATGRTRHTGPLYNELVLDETMAGTTQTWKSSASSNDRLGLSDMAYIMAVAENVTGTTNVVITGEHSADGQNWKSWGTVLSQSPVVSGVPYVGTFGGSSSQLLHYARLSVQLTGSSPQCRLKVYATGRSQ